MANVGDSCAYLDTGSEVLQVTLLFTLDSKDLAHGDPPITDIDLNECGPFRVSPKIQQISWLKDRSKCCSTVRVTLRGRAKELSKFRLDVFVGSAHN